MKGTKEGGFRGPHIYYVAKEEEENKLILDHTSRIEILF
jgi:hypothetical protein